MRRAYYNQWSFHHGDAALPDTQSDDQLGMAVYNIPAKVVTWTNVSENGDPSIGGSTQKPISKRPSKLLAILIVLFVIFLLAFTSTLIAWGVLTDGFDSRKGVSDDEEDNAIGNGQNRLCVSDDCTQIAGDIVRHFDKTADPCDDFYQFVCGKYTQEVPIPRDKDKTGTMDQMEHRVKMQLRTLFATPISNNESSNSRLVKQFYRACMDVQALQEQGLEPLKRAVQEFGGWPDAVDDSGWNGSDYAWERSNAILRSKYGVHALMIVTVEYDFKNNTRKLITIDQPDAEEDDIAHVSKAARARGKSLLHSALDSMVDLALEFGADRDSVISDMEEILLLEILLDNITISEGRRRDRLQFYNPMSLVELRDQIPEIDWDVLFKFLLPPELRIFDREVIFNVADLPYLKRLEEVLKKFSKRTLANYHIYYLADTYVRYLAPTLRDLRRSPAKRFLKTPATSSLGLARWEECVDETAALLPWGHVGEMYANRSIPENVKYEAQLMFTFLQEATGRALYKNGWMDNSTSVAAIFKLNHMAMKMLDVRSVNGTTDIAREYEKLNFTNVSYFDAAVQLNSFRNRVTFLSLRHSGDDHSVDMLASWSGSTSPASVNAYYRFDKNEVVLPIALLQNPLFSSQVPGYIRYSRLGALAAHEIMHGYDEDGRQYDAYGNLRYWWTNLTVQRFENREECLIDQYFNITDKTSGHQLNGKLTLSENLADHGGIWVAYAAYQLWKKQQNLDDEERLPGLATFTTAQTFFLSFANVWCESIRPEALALFIDEDVHTLGKYRVNVPLQNLPDFSEVFNCPLGSQMNPVKKCQVW